MELEETILNHRNKLNSSLPRPVDLGFWNKDGEYIEDIQEIDLEKE
jgi:hypothetical protein